MNGPEEGSTMANAKAKKATTIIKLKKFFGYKSGQGLKEFKAEMDQLSKEEQKELADLIPE